MACVPVRVPALGAATLVPDTETPWVVAPVEVMLIVPAEVPSVAAFNLTKTVVADTVPPVCVIVRVEAKDVLFNEYSKLDTAPKVISAVRSVPDTVIVCVPAGVEPHCEKALNVPDTDIVGEAFTRVVRAISPPSPTANTILSPTAILCKSCPEPTDSTVHVDASKDLTTRPPEAEKK